MRSAYLALSAGAAMALAASHPARNTIIIEDRPEPHHTPKRRAVGRSHHRVTTYERKTPTTPADFARLERAEQKRRRKAEKLRATVAAGGSAERVAVTQLRDDLQAAPSPSSHADLKG